LLLAFAAAMALMLTATAGGAQTPQPAKPTVCGTQPGEEVGAYSYVKAWNMRCGRAREVASNAYERFCDPVERCSIDPNSGATIRGGEQFNGWTCSLRLGYEFSRIGCEKRDRHFIQESGA
jgi:hypothetical protein